MSDQLPAAAPPINPSLAFPDVAPITGSTLAALTTALGVPRDLLPSDEQISDALTVLPKLLRKIPPQHRDERMVRMCVAVANGLFDSAINYAWNAAVVALRDKVRTFGINVVPQVTNTDFDEAKLLNLKDAELLDLCLKLNLITEEGSFVLDQCRDIRNNLSAAHPSVGVVDEHEFANFLSRCAKHALANEHNPKGVDIQGFLKALKTDRFSSTQVDEWCTRLGETFQAQRELLLGTLHGIYCDPGSGEESRLNSISICGRFADKFTPRTRSELIDRHQEYRAKGDDPRYKASVQFFEKLGLLALLNEAELHSLLSNACKTLLSVHNEFNNFYNEPPFAERLSALSAQQQVPESAREEFVEVVITCAVGNAYGTCNAAMPSYSKMVRSFSPAEIKLMLELPESGRLVAGRIKAYARCKTAYRSVVALLSPESVPTQLQSVYDKWTK